MAAGSRRQCGKILLSVAAILLKNGINIKCDDSNIGGLTVNDDVSVEWEIRWRTFQTLSRRVIVYL